MKRALLIAGGTVGGLGAVLAITPPQLTSSSSLSLGGGTTLPGTSGGTTAAPASATTKATPAATKSTAVKPAASKSATATASASATTSSSPTTSTSPSASPTPTATKTTAAPATQNVSGTFTGDAINVGYGIVQVKITVNNGKITDAQAVQAPSGRNDRFTQMSVPLLRQKTLAAQSSQITGVSGASYTSYGWYKSLVSALSKAGL
jgi:uncharacterized protein with FMN-binding domain